MAVRSRFGNQNLADAPFDQDFDFGLGSHKLLTVYVHSTVPIVEDISVTYKSADGSDYDTLIEKRRLQNETDYVFEAEGTIALNEADQVNVNVTNANTTGHVYVSVKAANAW